MTSRLHGGRLAACVIVLAGSCFAMTASQTTWVNTSSPLKLNASTGGIGVTMSFSGSGSLVDDNRAFVIGLAVFMAFTILLSLLPYLRFLALAILAAGGLAVLVGFGALSEIRQPSGSGVLDRLSDTLVERSPAVGVYLIIIGGSLAVLGGILTLLTPRSTITAHHQAPVP